MSFNAIEELKTIVNDIEGKVPTEIEDYLHDKIEFLKQNDINDRMHIGRTDWTRTFVAEWLLSMFVGTVEMAKENKLYYNAFGEWLKHVYHFVIDNKGNLQD